MPLPFADTLELTGRSQQSWDAAVRGLSGEQARTSSALPGWTRGHVITHLARNADAMMRMTQGVVTGTEVAMYPGGPEARNAAIEEGADRPISLLVADSEFSGQRLLAVLPLLTEPFHDTVIPWRRPAREWPAWRLPELRWRELEIHHVDLDVGFTVDDWSPEFVREMLDEELPLLADRAPGIEQPDLPPAHLLAWLIGRPTSRDLPELPPWP